MKKDIESFDAYYNKYKKVADNITNVPHKGATTGQLYQSLCNMKRDYFGDETETKEETIDDLTRNGDPTSLHSLKTPQDNRDEIIQQYKQLKFSDEYLAKQNEFRNKYAARKIKQ